MFVAVITNHYPEWPDGCKTWQSDVVKVQPFATRDEAHEALTSKGFTSCAGSRISYSRRRDFESEDFEGAQVLSANQFERLYLSDETEEYCKFLASCSDDELEAEAQALVDERLALWALPEPLEKKALPRLPALKRSDRPSSRPTRTELEDILAQSFRDQVA